MKLTRVIELYLCDFSIDWADSIIVNISQILNSPNQMLTTTIQRCPDSSLALPPSILHIIQLPQAIAILHVPHFVVPILSDLIFHPHPYLTYATVPALPNLVLECSNRRQFVVVVWTEVGEEISIDDIGIERVHRERMMMLKRMAEIVTTILFLLPMSMPTPTMIGWRRQQ